MSVIDTLITDRTEADKEELLAVKELARGGDATAFARIKTEDFKGGYNASDLNRVGQACAYLYDLMTAMGYAVAGYTALKTDWATDDVPTQAQMTTYLATVAALKAVWSAAQTIPATMNNLGYEGANNIEKLLIEIEDISQRINAIYIRSGAWNAYSGMGFYIKN